MPEAEAKKQTGEKSDLEVRTIPRDFYAGINPVVKFKEVEKIVAVEKERELTPGEKRALDEAKLHRHRGANILASKKFIFLGGLVLFLLLVGGGMIYIWIFQNGSESIETPPVVPLTQISEISTTTTPAATSTPVTTTTPEIIPRKLPIDFPSSLLGIARDFDNDNIADLAEEIFGTDPADADTDGDKYPDGHELYYLYNPSGFEPMRLIASGLVEDYKNPIFNYRVYVPRDWAIGVVDVAYREVMFSSINGESIMIRVYDFARTETFTDWFFTNAPEEKLTDLSDFTTAFKLAGKKRQDGLVYYFTDRNYIYVLTYHPNEDRVVNFKIVMDIIARSFRPAETEDAAVSETAPGFTGESAVTSSIGAIDEESATGPKDESANATTTEDATEAGDDQMMI